MLDTVVAKRYAKSLIKLSKEMGVMNEVNEDMKLFSSVCEKNRELPLVLKNPIIPSAKKLSILEALFNGKMNKIALSFFVIVTKKGREKFLWDIAKSYTDQYKVLKGIQTAEIISATGLDDNLRQKVYQILRDSNNSEVELHEKVDKDLIGGFVIRVGDKQYDASIASELKKLAREFGSNPYIARN
ncbi:MAG: ATP synthase F1 subunit delta [Bacteroidia bacterium]|nr:ATP synthase F1 subunit delta [Bacteroidia bacterium]